MYYTQAEVPVFHLGCGCFSCQHYKIW